MWVVSRAEPGPRCPGSQWHCPWVWSPWGERGKECHDVGERRSQWDWDRWHWPGCTGVGQVGLGSLWHQGQGWPRGRGCGRDRCLWQAAGQAGETAREVEGGVGPLPASMDGAVLQRRWQPQSGKALHPSPWLGRWEVWALRRTAAHVETFRPHMWARQ